MSDKTRVSRIVGSVLSHRRRPRRATIPLAALLVIAVAGQGQAALAATETSATTTPQGFGLVINEVSPSAYGDHANEYVEIRNLSQTARDVSGWELWVCAPHQAPRLLASLPLPTTLAPAEQPGDYLLLGHIAGYHGPVPPDVAYHGAEIPDDGGVMLLGAGQGYVDGVGFSAGLACTETAPAQVSPHGAVSRNSSGADTDNNAADFTSQARSPIGRG